MPTDGMQFFVFGLLKRRVSIGHFGHKKFMQARPANFLCRPQLPSQSLSACNSCRISWPSCSVGSTSHAQEMLIKMGSERWNLDFEVSVLHIVLCHLGGRGKIAFCFVLGCSSLPFQASRIDLSNMLGGGLVMMGHLLSDFLPCLDGRFDRHISVQCHSWVGMAVVVRRAGAEQ
jgi:hypothetical protein